MNLNLSGEKWLLAPQSTMRLVDGDMLNALWSCPEVIMRATEAPSSWKTEMKSVGLTVIYAWFSHLDKLSAAEFALSFFVSFALASCFFLNQSGASCFFPPSFAKQSSMVCPLCALQFGLLHWAADLFPFLLFRPLPFLNKPLFNLLWAAAKAAWALLTLTSSLTVFASSVRCQMRSLLESVDLVCRAVVLKVVNRGW